MSETHPAALPIDELLAQCTERRTKRSGPGGQHRNKVETAVVLTHAPTGVSAEANERRSQSENRRVAAFRLRAKLAIEYRVLVVPGSPPSEKWQCRVQGERISVGDEHDDFPTLLAEALDRLAVCEFALPLAAGALGISATQLAKLVRREPLAWEMVNRERTARALPRLK